MIKKSLGHVLIFLVLVCFSTSLHAAEAVEEPGLLGTIQQKVAKIPKKEQPRLVFLMKGTDGLSINGNIVHLTSITINSCV